ncbi:hypothetical protein L6452_36793 [Arctium lappa]|uniref:Uncharacterized protein n=1 Tax=Arctium lappa TaxID=4217 RepID=A0ACB8Y139_ARCLA|nr:hypothetical protein L6452_36793 [Arctium lappa]
MGNDRAPEMNMGNDTVPEMNMGNDISPDMSSGILECVGGVEKIVEDNKITENILSNPTIPIQALQTQLQQKYEINISVMKAMRAKSIATQKIWGDFEEQFSLLRDYIQELKRCNPGTTVKLDVEDEPNPNSTTRKFKRIYVCLGPLKQGFKVGKRDLLGLDGTFMKGPFPGQVLAAVGIDSNNGTYPLAYGIVEAESMASWSWFLQYLGEDLDLFANSNFTFISDRQKGILPAIAKLFPYAEHRFCLRHIHDNMKQQWKGKAYKDHLWKCATATTIPQFQQAMEDLRMVNQPCYDWLKQIPPQHWARSHFTG